MATTTAWLQDNEHAELAWVLVFDGVDLIFTTSDDTSGIAAAWSGTDWSTVKSGLEVPRGTIQQSIGIFDPTTKPDSLTIDIVDAADTFVDNGLLGRPSDMAETHLTSSIDSDDTTVPVKDDSDFASSGHAYIGHERFAYTGTSGTSFTTVTRGKNALFGTSSTSGRFGRPHDINPQTGGRAAAPAITEVPRVWWNRMVALYLVHKEAGVWATKANAWFAWCGRIKGWTDKEGVVSLNCVSIIEALQSTVFPNQLRGELLNTITVGEDYMRIVRTSQYIGTATTLGVPSESTSEDIINKIAAQFDAWHDDATIDSTDKWSVQIVSTPEGPRVMFAVETNTGTSDSFSITLPVRIINLLGVEFFGFSDVVQTELLGNIPLTSTTGTGTKFQAIGNRAPATNVNPGNLVDGETFQISAIEGNWTDQPDVPEMFANDAEGIVAVDDTLTAVTESSGTFTVKAGLRNQGPGTSVIAVHMGKPLEERTAVKQVWLRRGRAGDLMLSLLLGTGTASYNDTTYDVTADKVGIGLPYELVDVASFQQLDAPYELLIDEPLPLRDVIEEILATYSRTIIWKNGQLTLTYPAFDADAAPTFTTLTESSKPDNSLASITYGDGDIVNRVTLRYHNTDYIRLTEGRVPIFEKPKTIVAENVASMSDHGQRPGLEINARGILDPEQWKDNVAEPALAYFGRPLGRISWPVNMRFAHVVPGDMCKVTADYLTDPRTGSRGISGLACWVLDSSFDWTAGAGRLELLFLADHPASRYCQYAPSAKVDETENSGSYTAGYWDDSGGSGNYYLTVKGHEFSRSTDAVDASHFAGKEIRVRQLSPSDPSSPDAGPWQPGCSAVNGNVLTLDAALTSFDANLEYVVELADYTTVSASEQDLAFIGDFDDFQYSDGTPCALWAGHVPADYLTHDATTDAATGFVRPTDTDDDLDEPMSTHKAWHLLRNTNNLYSYRTRNMLISLADFGVELTHNSAGTWRVILGPVFVPLFAVGFKGYRQIDWIVYGRSTLTFDTNWRLRSHAQLPVDASDMVDVTWPGPSSTDTITSDSTSYAWREGTAFNPVLTTITVGGVRITGTYLSLEMRGGFARCDGLAVWEQPL